MAVTHTFGVHLRQNQEDFVPLCFLQITKKKHNWGKEETNKTYTAIPTTTQNGSRLLPYPMATFSNRIPVSNFASLVANACSKVEKNGS